MEQVILSYGDSLLRLSDVVLLDPPNWLNDNVIGFTFEYLASSLAPHLSGRVCFISPEVSQFIKCCGREAPTFLEPLALPDKDLILLPVNDNAGPEAGGTHWSLLAYVRQLHGFFHYDSSPGTNFRHAQLMARHLSPLLGSNLSYKEEEAPAQHNSYDCGMYVVCIAEAMCAQHLHGCDSLKDITPQYVTRKRMEWKDIIRGLSSLTVPNITQVGKA
ncbi:sentrin-specific protease 8 [Bombina bombina]|uniref:sentrin-specific protease 8 n=1 Tax=Bombina bombina TaxID=8345 RepID=UPI00235A841A|nr:sentrin-specific protease 8 [Bombina bombina]